MRPRGCRTPATLPGEVRASYAADLHDACAASTEMLRSFARSPVASSIRNFTSSTSLSVGGGGGGGGGGVSGSGWIGTPAVAEACGRAASRAPKTSQVMCPSNSDS
jgi:hypothetical protein